MSVKAGFLLIFLYKIKRKAYNEKNVEEYDVF